MLLVPIRHSSVTCLTLSGEQWGRAPALNLVRVELGAVVRWHVQTQLVTPSRRIRICSSVR